MQIINDFTNVNFESRKQAIEYLVVHYTGNDGDTAKNNCTYFKNEYRGVSAHYFVDENEIRCCVPDNKVSWAVGANAYKHPKCRNQNSISVEMCSRKDSKGIFYIKDETIANTIELLKELARKYNIKEENILRHYDVTGKYCPAPLVDENAWRNFKSRLKEDTVVINGVKVRTINKDGYNYVHLRDLCSLLGKEVNYNSATKSITLK